MIFIEIGKLSFCCCNFFFQWSLSVVFKLHIFGTYWMLGSTYIGGDFLLTEIVVAVTVWRISVKRG